jgi:hypothetical protein
MLEDLNSPLLMPAIIVALLLVTVGLGLLTVSLWYQRQNRRRDADDAVKIAVWCIVVAILLPLAANIAPLLLQAFADALTR